MDEIPSSEMQLARDVCRLQWILLVVRCAACSLGFVYASFDPAKRIKFVGCRDGTK